MKQIHTDINMNNNVNKSNDCVSLRRFQERDAENSSVVEISDNDVLDTENEANVNTLESPVSHLEISVLERIPAATKPHLSNKTDKTDKTDKTYKQDICVDKSTNTTPTTITTTATVGTNTTFPVPKIYNDKSTNTSEGEILIKISTPVTAATSANLNTALMYLDSKPQPIYEKQSAAKPDCYIINLPMESLQQRRDAKANKLYRFNESPTTHCCPHDSLLNEEHLSNRDTQYLDCFDVFLNLCYAVTHNASVFLTRRCHELRNLLDQ